jgi:hypothetical protein
MLLLRSEEESVPGHNVTHGNQGKLERRLPGQGKNGPLDVPLLFRSKILVAGEKQPAKGRAIAPAQTSYGKEPPVKIMFPLQAAQGGIARHGTTAHCSGLLTPAFRL